MEIYAASRLQDGKTSNEDAFLIGRGEIPWVALCDGSGNAQGVAKRALGTFQRLFADASAEEVAQFRTWSNWAKLLDSALLGGPQSTLVAVAVLNNRIVGTCTGDSRLYLLPAAGDLQILTEEADKARLGSGKVKPFPIHQSVRPGDVVLLLSDGAWTPLGLPKIQALRSKLVSHHFSEFPEAILQEAGIHGRADDMTVVALKI
jgi:hypothetical protein